MSERNEKIEAELFQRKLDSLIRDISRLQLQKERLTERLEKIDRAITERTEKKNLLVVSYIAEPLGGQEVDFKKARWLRAQLEKGNFEVLEELDETE